MNHAKQPIYSLKAVSCYDMLDPNEGRKEFRYLIYDELPPHSTKQEGLETSVNHIHVDITLNHDETRRLQQEEPS